MYTTVSEIEKIVIPLLKIAAFVQIGDAMQTGAAFALRGLKDTKIPMLMNFFNYWIVGFSLAYFLGIKLGRGAEGIWLGLAVALFLSGIFLILRLHYFTKNGRNSH